jgi:hypothetical protein
MPIISDAHHFGGHETFADETALSHQRGHLHAAPVPRRPERAAAIGGRAGGRMKSRLRHDGD